MVIHTSFPDFLLFLYVHLSHADNNYDPTEITVIKNKMSSLFPAETDLEKKLYATIKEYNAFDKSNLKEVVEQSFKHFTADHDLNKSDVLSAMYDIINADGKIENTETVALEVLKKAIDN